MAYYEAIGSAFSEGLNSRFAAAQACVEHHHAGAIGQLPFNIGHAGAVLPTSEIDLLPRPCIECVGILGAGTFDNPRSRVRYILLDLLADLYRELIRRRHVEQLNLISSGGRIFVVADRQCVDAALGKSSHSRFGTSQANVEYLGAVRIGQFPIDIIHSGAAAEHAEINSLPGSSLKYINILSIRRLDNAGAGSWNAIGNLVTNLDRQGAMRRG